MKMVVPEVFMSLEWIKANMAIKLRGLSYISIMGYREGLNTRLTALRYLPKLMAQSLNIHLSTLYYNYLVLSDYYWLQDHSPTL